ncbi:MAG: prepilin-type N-terminal cleavage/methylation domain-containing protein [Planctomycetota bacterium]
MRFHRGRHLRFARTGFTLIELLVVISIIALLISLLLPALSSARRTGQRVACMATLRNVAVGVQNYATDNDDAILGGPGTSGLALVKPNGTLPAAGAGHLVQRWDFYGSLAQQWGLPIPLATGTNTTAATRFKAIRGEPALLCKANNFLAKPFAGANAGVGRMISFNTIRWPLFIQAKNAAEAGMPAGDTNGTSFYTNSISGSNDVVKLPLGWRPVVSRMGVAASKVYCADGARFSDINTPPDYDLTLNAGWGGAFSDGGPFSTFSKSWDRSLAPGNGVNFSGRPTDARAYAYRHSSGVAPPGAAGNAFKLNLVFFDGHAETQGDLTASNPHIYLPKDTKMDSVAAVWKDTIQAFGLTAPFKAGP